MKLEFLFPLLFFLQLQWLSIVAGMLWGGLSGRLNRTAIFRWIVIATLLIVQVSGTSYLISEMICGQTINAVLQGVGGVCLCILGGLISWRLLPNLTTGRLAAITAGGSLLLYFWQRLLLAKYSSAEWAMLFLLSTAGLFLLTATTKIVSLAMASETDHGKQRIINLFMLGLGYLIYTVVTTFSTAIAFDCGI